MFKESSLPLFLIPILLIAFMYSYNYNLEKGEKYTRNFIEKYSTQSSTDIEGWHTLNYLIDIDGVSVPIHISEASIEVSSLNIYSGDLYTKGEETLKAIDIIILKNAGIDVNKLKINQRLLPSRKTFFFNKEDYTNSAKIMKYLLKNVEENGYTIIPQESK